MRAAKRRLAKETRESALFKENTAEREQAKRKRKSAASRGVLLTVTTLSEINFNPKSKNETRTTVVRRICFGRVKASVVRVVKRRGSTRSKAPSKI